MINQRQINHDSAKPSIFLQKLAFYSTQNEIPKSIFKYSTIKKIIFPPSAVVKKIGASAFSECSNLKFVSINGAVEEIGPKCFYQCENLTKFQIVGESRLRVIGESAFEWTNIQNFNFPSSLKKIGDYSINNIDEYDLSKTKITNFDASLYNNRDSVVLLLPKTIRKLKIHNIFNEVRIEDGGKYFINSDSFLLAKFQPSIYSALKTRKSYFIRRGIERINGFAFCHARMRAICFPSSLKEIGRQAFERCENLEKIKFASPSSLVKICEYAFCFCKNLKEVRFPSSLVDLCDHAFDQCLNLSFVSFPSNSKLKTIGQSTFFYCKVERNAKLPPNVRYTNSKYLLIDDEFPK